MPNNRGRTRLKSRRSPRGMQDYDSLPAPLRQWMANAKRPWSAKTVQKAYDKAVAKTGDPNRAIISLNDLQARLLAKDASYVWGPEYPEA